MKKYKVSRDELHNWFNKLPECCTVFTAYYPNTLSAYEDYLFMFETDYDDFVIDLFSQFPTTAFFFKVSDKLFVYSHIAKPYIRNTDFIKNLNGLYIPHLMVELLEKGIVKSKARVELEYHKARDL
jgi:hypothetical protein